MKLWLVYQAVTAGEVEFYGLFRKKADAESALRIERENLRAAGNGNWRDVLVEEFDFEPRAALSK